MSKLTYLYVARISAYSRMPTTKGAIAWWNIIILCVYSKLTISLVGVSGNEDNDRAPSQVSPLPSFLVYTILTTLHLDLSLFTLKCKLLRPSQVPFLIHLIKGLTSASDATAVTSHILLDLEGTICYKGTSPDHPELPTARVSSKIPCPLVG